MKKYELTGSVTILTDILNSIKSKMYHNFSIDIPRSVDYARNTSNPIDKMASIVSTNTNNPIAFVSLAILSSKLSIANINPKNPGALTVIEYNNIFDNFYEEVILTNEVYLNNIQNLTEKIS
jgi:hypothetical protein